MCQIDRDQQHIHQVHEIHGQQEFRTACNRCTQIEVGEPERPKEISGYELAALIFPADSPQALRTRQERKIPARLAAFARVGRTPMVHMLLSPGSFLTGYSFTRTMPPASAMAFLVRACYR